MAAEEPFRSFLAVEVNEDVRAALRALIARLKKSDCVRATWVKPENLHITMRFLGNITLSDSQSLSRSLKLSLEGIQPFPLRIHGVGVFPTPQRPRTLWAGAEAPEGIFAGLKARVDDGVAVLHLPEGGKTFTPHITLARIRKLQDRGAFLSHLDREKHFGGGEFTVGSVSLFESRLTPRGSVYRKLETYSF